MRRHSLFLAVVCVGLGGCSARQVVHVVDAGGVPVAGAEVQAVSASMNSAGVTTDASGDAVLPVNMQGAKWVQVSKAGFKVVQEAVPARWPLRVVLTR